MTCRPCGKPVSIPRREFQSLSIKALQHDRLKAQLADLMRTLETTRAQLSEARSLIASLQKDTP